MESSYIDVDFSIDVDAELQEEEEERVKQIDELVSTALPEAPDDFLDEESDAFSSQSFDEEGTNGIGENRRQNLLVSEGESRRLQYDQLEVLYTAQNRQIRQLTDELEREKADGSKSKRILNHRLAAARIEMQRKEKEFESITGFVEEDKNEKVELEGRIGSLDAQLGAVTEARDSILSELHIAHATIDSLKQQLNQLNRSETLSRARNEHEQSLAVMRKQHQDELLRIQLELDQTKDTLSAKRLESDRLRAELGKAFHDAETSKLDRAGLVNKLTKNLEESQLRNQQLLEFGGSHHVAEMKVQLQQLMTVCQDKQSENDSLRSQFSAMDKKLRDALVEKQQSEELMNSTITQLRGTNGYKRNPGIEAEVTHLKLDLDHVEEQLRAKEHEVDEWKGQVVPLKRIIEEERRRRCEVEHQLKCIEMEVLDTQESKEARKKLEERVAELEEEFQNQAVLHEEDKKESLEKCRNGCLQLHNASYERLKESLMKDQSKELDKLKLEISGREHEVSKLEEKLASGRQQVERQMSETLEKVEIEASSEKDRALKDQHRALTEECKSRLALVKVEWLKSKDREVKQAVQNAVQIAQSQWKCEAEKDKRMYAESKRKTEEEKWKRENESTLKTALQQARSQHKKEQNQLEIQHRKDITALRSCIVRLQDELKRLKQAEEMEKRRSFERRKRPCTVSVECQTERNVFAEKLRALYETALAKMKTDALAYVKQMRKRTEKKAAELLLQSPLYAKQHDKVNGRTFQVHGE